MRTVRVAMVLVMMLVSTGGCWVGIGLDDRDGRGHGRQQKHDQRR